MTLYLGIDIGTSRTKVGVLDVRTGGLVARRSAPTPVEEDPWGGVRDARELLVVVMNLIRDTIGDPAVEIDRLAGVSVGSIGEEVVLLDDEGEVTGPVLAWHADHGRCARETANLAELGALDDTFSVFKIAWLASERPEELAAARTFTAIADYVAHSLAGLGIDDVFLNQSHSSRTGLADVSSFLLRTDVLPLVGAEHVRLPRLVPSATVIGRTDLGGSLAEAIPVVAGGHDHWCGAFGSGARSAGDVYVSAGTSEAQVMLVEDVPEAPAEGVDVGIFVAGGLRYLHRATPSGRIYQTWRDTLFAGVEDDEMWRAVDAVVDSVEAARIDELQQTGQIVPLPTAPTPEHVMGSLLTGLANEAEKTTRLLESIAGRSANDVTVAGVPAGRPEWRRLRQNATSRPLRFVSEPEATLVGVALLAQLGVEGAASTPIPLTVEGAAP